MKNNSNSRGQRLRRHPRTLFRLIIAVVLIIILVVTAFGGIEQSEFDNQLVKGLIITLSVLYLLLAISSLVMLFMNNDAVKEITLRSEQGGSCKATLGVIRKLVKETFYGLEGVKTGKVALIVNEYGVKLKVSVRVTDRDVFETETYMRTLLEEVFKGALGFKFHTIEFKIVALQAKFKPDKAKVAEEVAEKVADHTANYAALPNMVETSLPSRRRRARRRRASSRRKRMLRARPRPSSLTKRRQPLPSARKKKSKRRRSLPKQRRRNIRKKRQRRLRRRRKSLPPKTRNERSPHHQRRA